MKIKTGTYSAPKFSKWHLQVEYIMNGMYDGWYKPNENENKLHQILTECGFIEDILFNQPNYAEICEEIIQGEINGNN